MPRRARIIIPGYLYHIVQRGNNQQYIFQEDNDYILYLKRIEEYRNKYKVDIFAYCLMGNHVHFIMRPKEVGDLARMFRSVNMRYAQYYQKKSNSCGHVWQGRFFSCLLSNEHMLEAIRYVEINPVRAKMVQKAWQYSWSSARAHMGKKYQWIKLADIKDVMEESSWEEYLQEKEDDVFCNKLKDMTRKNLVLGDDHFIVGLEKLLNRKLTPSPMGRPKKKK